MSASRDWPKESAPLPLQPGNWSVFQPVPQAVVGAGERLVRGPVVLGPGDVAAGDDRRQHEDPGEQGQRAQSAHRFPRRGGRGLGPAAEDEQQAQEQHRQAQVGGDQLVLEALLDREPAERCLGEDQEAGGDRAPDQQPMLAQPPKRLPARPARSAP